MTKFSRADWLVAIVCMSTDNKNDVRCNARAFSTEIKPILLERFPCYYQCTKPGSETARLRLVNVEPLEFEHL